MSRIEGLGWLNPEDQSQGTGGSCVALLNPETAPHDGTVILADFGWPWLVPAAWSRMSCTWNVAVYNASAETATSKETQDCWWEFETEDNRDLKGWLPIPQIPRNAAGVPPQFPDRKCSRCNAPVDHETEPKTDLLPCAAAEVQQGASAGCAPSHDSAGLRRRGNFYWIIQALRPKIEIKIKTDWKPKYRLWRYLQKANCEICGRRFRGMEEGTISKRETLCGNHCMMTTWEIAEHHRRCGLERRPGAPA